MLQEILAHYFTRPPLGDEAASIILNVATHQPHRDTSKFRASDAGKCHRMRNWKRQGKAGKQDLSFEVQMALQTGNLLHAFIQYALSRENVLAAAELELEDAHRIGHLDALIKDGDKLMLYDFKTVGGKQMYYLKKEARPKAEHVAQVLTYRAMWQTARVLDPIHECRIAYVSRDTLEVLDLPVADERHAAVTRDWEMVGDYWARQATPPMCANGWECCKYCQYQADCLPGG